MYMYIQSEDVDQLLEEIHYYKPDCVLLRKEFSDLSNVCEIVNKIEEKIPSTIRDNDTKRISDVFMKDPDEVAVIQGPPDDAS